MEEELQKLKRKKIRRFFIYFFGIILYLVGVVSVSFYPEFSHRTYISENALIPGGAVFEYNEKSWKIAIENSNDYTKFRKGLSKTELQSSLLADWMVKKMQKLGLESIKHEFSFKQDGLNETITGYNVYSILRSKRGQGTESLVLSTRYNSQQENNLQEGDVSGFGLAASLLYQFQKKAWVAKDIIFIASDNRFGEEGIRAWLNQYYGISNFFRAGAIQAAINIDINPGEQFEYITILSEGANGQLPNLDLINTVRTISKILGVSEEQIILSDKSNLYDFLRIVPNKLVQLLTFMLNQAAGIPTGDHGIFNIYHIDAITISNTNSGSNFTRPNSGNRFMLHSKIQLGRILEGTFRSLNNLLEHLHQSFYYYLLPSPHFYISIGEYMISLGLILIGFTLKTLFGILSLKYDSSTTHSFCVVITFQLLGALVFSLPFIIQRFANLLTTNGLLLPEVMGWSTISSFLLMLITYFVIVPMIDEYFQREKNSNVKTSLLEEDSFFPLASLPIILFISSFSLLNFSFCLFCGILMVPLYSLLTPSQNTLLQVSQIILLIIISPLALLLCSTIYLQMDYEALLKFLAKIVTQHQLFSNLTYPFFCFIYLPTNLSYLKFFSRK